MALRSSPVSKPAPARARCRSFRSPGGADDELPDLSEIESSFLALDTPETTAALTALAVLRDDELSRARVERELARRIHELPRWPARIGEARIDELWQVEHVLGDADDVLLGATFAGGRRLTVVVLIDHNRGVVKDAFPLAEPPAAVIRRLRAKSEEDTRSPSWTRPTPEPGSPRASSAARRSTRRASRRPGRAAARWWSG